MRPISPAAPIPGMSLATIATLAMVVGLGSGCSISPAAERSVPTGVDVSQPTGTSPTATSRELEAFDQGPIFHILAGEFYGREKNYDQAAMHYAEVAKNSNDAAVLERAIQAAIFADRFDLAQELGERLRGLAPGNARAAAVMMISSLELGETEQADRALNQWLESDSGNVEKIFNETGQYLQKSLERERAVAYTHHLAERFPQQYEAQVVVAKLALSFGEMTLAREAASRAMSLRPDETMAYDLAMVIANRDGDVQQAIRVLEKAHNRFPDQGRYASGLIEARLAAGENESALALLERTLQIRPNDPELLRNVSLFAFRLDRPDLAEQALARLERLPGQSDVVHLIRGRVALQEADLAAAESALSRVSARSEHYANAQVLLAGARVDQGEPDAARRGLETALLSEEIDEADQQQLMLALASTLAQSGRFEESLDIADQAIDAWPDASDFRLQKAMTLFALDESGSAISVLRELIERDPEHAPALNALGYTLADEDRSLDEAEDLIGRALHIDPDNPAYLDSLGWLKYRQGDVQAALKALRSAYRSAPNAEIGAHLGEVLWVDGQRDAALGVWQESLKLDADDTTLLDTLRQYAPELVPADGQP
ncbi:tetratricopeptide repeat protein [Guyparkeria halophila]|uniref:Tetratricopeptide repeat protein n=2 Tax=Guyparkeria halophila TaxID=47960 RepID=A0A6I6D2T5_9GAMM|nr:tetratricopeptide repeat protein [Guyparkeria halophila]